MVRKTVTWIVIADGEKARIVGAMVPRTQKTWFFRLMGPEQLVQQNKDDFQKFVESTKFPE